MLQSVRGVAASVRSGPYHDSKVSFTSSDITEEMRTCSSSGDHYGLVSLHVLLEQNCKWRQEAKIAMFQKKGQVDRSLVFGIEKASDPRLSTM